MTLLAPHHRRDCAVTVAWIQECGEKPTFHLQSQGSPETHLLPVRSA